MTKMILVAMGLVAAIGAGAATLYLLPWLTYGSDVRVQGYPVATTELQRFEPMLGGWNGVGLRFQSAEDPGQQWESKLFVERVFDGHFVKRREIIDLGNDQTLATMSFIGWDWNNDRYNLMSVSNANEGGLFEELHSLGDGTFLIIRTIETEDGQPAVDQIVTSISQGALRISISRSIGSEPAFTRFEGEYRRHEAVTSDSIDLANVAPLTPPSQQADHIAPMAGAYRQVGKFGSWFGVTLDGLEYIDLELGGHSMLIHFDFEFENGARYYGASVTAWNPNANSFTGFMISNDGMSVPFEGHISEDGNQLMYISHNNFGGIQNLDRWIADIDQEAGLKSLSTLNLTGTQPPFTGLSLEFIPVQDDR